MALTSLAQKTVLITGASSGIGKATAIRFAKEGARLLLCARRYDRLVALAEELFDLYQAKVYIFALDVSDKAAVELAFSSLPVGWSPDKIDILINNAGLAQGWSGLDAGNPEEWDVVIDTNIKGFLYVTHEVLPHMVAKKSGHIINLGSIAGYNIYPNGNVYCASKFAVRALSQSMHADTLGKNIRVTLIAPGFVETEFSLVRLKDPEKAKKVYEGILPLTSEDIADNIVYCAQLPSHVNITELVVTPTAQLNPLLTYRDPV